MKYTIAERELLAGMDQRNANARASYHASVQNARNAQSAGAPGAAAYGGGMLCYYGADGYLRREPGVPFDERQRREAFHKAYVLPQRAAIRGKVWTGLTSIGTPSDILQEVSIPDYFERYRLYRRRTYMCLTDIPVASDVVTIRRVTAWHEGCDSWIMRKLGFGPYPQRGKAV